MVSIFWSILVGAPLVYVHLTIGESVQASQNYLPTPSSISLQNNSPNQSALTPPCTTSDKIFDGSSGNLTGKNVFTNPRLQWTRFRVLPDAKFDKMELANINQAMWNLWQIIPCVQFLIYPSSSQLTGDYMKLIKGPHNGCNSKIGRRGGEQIINLQSPGCTDVATIMHEFLHALGFHHEHNRYDRDNFITINWGNVQRGEEYNFKKVSTSDTTTFGVPYNYRSIMHYRQDVFTVNGKPTIVARNGHQIGPTGHLEGTDIQKLKRLYNC